MVGTRGQRKRSLTMGGATGLMPPSSTAPAAASSCWVVVSSAPSDPAKRRALRDSHQFMGKPSHFRPVSWITNSPGDRSSAPSSKCCCSAPRELTPPTSGAATSLANTHAR